MNVRVTKQQGGNIYEAHRAWASRPPDQCFDSLEEMHTFCSDYRYRSETVGAELSSLRILPHHERGDDLALFGVGEAQRSRKGGQGLRLASSSGARKDSKPEGIGFTNFSFSQLCSNLLCPSDFISTLPSNMASDVMNFKLKQLEKAGGKQSKLLLQKEFPNGGKGKKKKESVILRAATSNIYDRLWNSQVTEFLLKVNRNLKGRFQPPVENWKGEGGTGLYASDRDMFAFLVDKEKQLDVSGAELVRGFYISNNEVGSGSLRFCMFLCDYICGNHIIWDVSEAITIAARHAGNAATDTFNNLLPLAIAFQISKKASIDEDKVKNAQKTILGKDKEKTVDFVFEKRIASRRLAEAAWVSSDHREGVNPNSAWGMICGLTAMARQVEHYDKRAAIESGAAKLMLGVAA